MKINSLKLYWAGPKGIAGPRPSPACAAQAREGGKTAQQGVNPRPGSAWPAEAERLAGARAGATAGLGQRSAAVSGHGSASERAQETCEEKASSVG